MPTREGPFKTNDPWKLISKNPSKRRDMVPEQKNPSSPASKNKGSTNYEPPHQMTSNRNKSEMGTDNPSIKRTNAKAHNPSKASDKDFYRDTEKETPSTYTLPRNKGTVDKENPKPHINSGSTKVHNYPKGRNRGRNFKG